MTFFKIRFSSSKERCLPQGVRTRKPATSRTTWCGRIQLQAPDDEREASERDTYDSSVAGWGWLSPQKHGRHLLVGKEDLDI